jgi:hypothetical protein
MPPILPTLAPSSSDTDIGTLQGRATVAPCQGGAHFEGVEDDAGELSLEAADCLAAALPFGRFALQVGARGRVVASLRDRDPVERAVELAVAAAVEPVPLHAA